MTDNHTTTDLGILQRVAAQNPPRRRVPVDEEGLYAYIKAAPRVHRPLIASWLYEQEGGGRDWTEMVDRIREDVTNAEAIADARADLRTALANAESAVRVVRNVYDRLVGELNDVEYAESNLLLAHYLAEAERAIATAAALNPKFED